MRVSKLWVDDLREDPDTQHRAYAEPEGWAWAKSSETAIKFLASYYKNDGWVLDEISLDHDLGYTSIDGLFQEDRGTRVLDWMIVNDVWPKVLTIHTANPVARDRMLQAANAEAPDWVDIQRMIW